MDPGLAEVPADADGLGLADGRGRGVGAGPDRGRAVGQHQPFERYDPVPRWVAGQNIALGSIKKVKLKKLNNYDFTGELVS